VLAGIFIQIAGEKKKVADLLAWWRIGQLLLFDPMQGQTMRARDSNSMDHPKEILNSFTVHYSLKVWRSAEFVGSLLTPGPASQN
jgi:hypothetical protein